MSIKKRFDLSGKVAIITGSSKGIGLSIARGLAENGAKVVISSRKQDAVDAIAKEFNEAGLEAIGIACHIGEADQREALIAKTIDSYGRIDILVNNAAINPYYGPLEASDEEIFDKIMNVNVKAPWILSNLAQPHMKTQGGGSIINISSVEGVHPGFNLGLYSVTKSAMIMLSKNQAKEWGKHGIRSNAVCPGLVKTKLSEALWSNEKMVAGYTGIVPLKRIAEPDELAGVVMLLASDAGSYMTGGVYTVDGGYLISG
ncbi:glucose 1-dehydrogenase [Maribacter sp. M208]|uniref:glucose 1-dehydrogenase n=1 Tax=Maribacter huludaoensis TaxID=3030010 RepID=UPI0023EC2CC7|nr:glucose 1-dehydrogenase [Maribacter huludaoensis]MDF4222545.1 glucose 1-dehydrogenase [Maribacter huludaoensis]